MYIYAYIYIYIYIYNNIYISLGKKGKNITDTEKSLELHLINVLLSLLMVWTKPKLTCQIQK